MAVAIPQPVWSPAVGTPTEAFWAGNVADHVVQRFASATERNARWTAPPHGVVCTITTPIPTMWQWQSSAWVQIGPSILASPFGSAQTIAGALTVNGLVTVPLTPTAAGHATSKNYVDSQVGGRLSLGGGTMTGNIQLPSSAPNTANAAVPSRYVDTNFVQKTGGGTQVMTPNLNIGDDPNEGDGVMIFQAGAITATRNTPGLNLRLHKRPGADANEQVFIGFDRGAFPGQRIGSIVIATGTTVAYRTSSDYRLKEFVSPITDAATRVASLARAAFRGRWTAGGPDEWDMLNAHDIAEVAPYAVGGEKDEVDADGGIVTQQVDYASLVPLLASALGDALDRIDRLEARAA